jgi:renalase
MQGVASAGVIGAGISGLACAQTLRDAGVRVTVLEKSRGVGGRCATRRMEDATGVDHGAQYFTARDAGFAAVVDQWRAAGVAALWSGRIVSLTRGAVAELSESHNRFVGVPAMSAIAKRLAEGLDVRINATVQAIRRTGEVWHVEDAAGAWHGPFDALVLTAPPSQTLALVGNHSPAMTESLAKVAMAPCWAVILQVKEPLQVAFDAAFVHESPLNWVARNASKPERQPGNYWTLHATADWSRGHLEESADEVARALVEAFWQATWQPAQLPEFVVAHRWRYALPIDPLPQRFLLDPPIRLAACGDWCGGPRVEGAYLSGAAAADALLASG